MNTATRGVVLAIVAVVLGVIILGQGFDDPAVDTATATATATPADSGTADSADDAAADGAVTDDGGTDVAADDAATDASVDDAGDGGEVTPPADDASSSDDDGNGGPQLKPPAEVRVLVANDTTTGGLAGTVTNTLTAAGYATLTATNTTTQGADPEAQSVVYFGQGYRPDAIEVARILGLAETSIAQMPDAPPVEDLGRANILVVVGADLVPAA